MEKNQAPLLPKPLKVLRKTVASSEIGRYYLKSEFNRLFLLDKKINNAIDERIDSLDENTFWRLLEALSFSLRLNWMFWFIGSDKFTWNEEVWQVENITLTGMDPNIDKVIHSEEINSNPLRFSEYLEKYFKLHPEDDPEGLEQFRNHSREVAYTKLTLRESDGKIKILDGSNRLMNLVRNGAREITAFVAHETNPKGKMKIGDSTFYLLRFLYEKSNEEDQKAILATTKRLMQEASDGKTAVKSYWVDHVRDEELKKLGKKLLTEA